MQGQELTVRQNEDIIITPPDVVLENARIAAKALADVISHKKHPIIMNGEQYLEYEDLQTLGQFYGYSVRTGGTSPIEIDSIKGAKAHADLIHIKTGEIIGGAESYCMRDEDNWKNKPWFQLASMAQTRAGAKALRNRLAWVVVLAGYKPTPAEEMTGAEHQTMPVEHLCPIHNVPFFKKGKMTGYAHKLDNGEWCNEDAEAPQPPPSTSEKKTTAGPEPQPDQFPPAGEESKPPVEDNPLLVEALKCKTGAALASFAGKHGYSLEKFVKLVGCNPVDVKSVESAARVLFGK